MMPRLLLPAFFLLLAWLVLRRLWPGLLHGWRTAVFLVLGGLSLGAWAVPLTLSLGQGGPWPDLHLSLRLFALGWTIAAVMVVLAGLPVLLVRGWVERRASARAAKEVPPVSPAPAPGPVDLRRRQLLLNVGRAVPVAAVATSTAGLASGLSRFTVREVEVRLRDLPAALEGFRIGQITDVHVGTFIDVDYLRGAVAAMNQAGVDLQVMTGDLIDDLDQLDGTIDALAECRARHGMLAVLGNHEHWRGVGAIQEAYAERSRRGAPLRLLVDEAHTFEHAGQRVRVVGVDYPMRGRGRVSAARTAQMERSAEVAFQGASPAEELVLCLSHHPDCFPIAAARGARLTLSGHTHGGQVALLGMPVFRFAFKYMLGAYQEGDSHLYVSGGTGHWLPYRLGVPPEVTVLTLRAA